MSYDTDAGDVLVVKYDNSTAGVTAGTVTTLLDNATLSSGNFSEFGNFQSNFFLASQRAFRLHID